MGKRREAKAEGSKQWKWWTEQEARGQLEEWKASGKALSTFAQERGVSASRLRWWRKRIGEWSSPDESMSTAEASTLVEARLVERSESGVAPKPGGPAAVTVYARGGVVVEVADTASVPAEWVAVMVKELGRSSP